MIVFVGDKPSKANKDPKIAFVGTKSYKTLLNWIADMNIDIIEVILTNKVKINPFMGEAIVNLDRYSCMTLENHKFIALGDQAEKKLQKLGLSHFKLPHPSGLNRKINDKKWLKQQLKACENWLNA